MKIERSVKYKNGLYAPLKLDDKGDFNTKQPKTNPLPQSNGVSRGTRNKI